MIFGIGGLAIHGLINSSEKVFQFFVGVLIVYAVFWILFKKDSN